MGSQADTRIGRRTDRQYSHSATVACMTTLSARNIRKSLDQGEEKGRKRRRETEKEEVKKTHREEKDEEE